MRRLGYLHYDDSDGGCNHHNTYILRKLTVQCSNGKPFRDQTPPVQELDARPFRNQTRNYPLEDITVRGEASPLPCNSKASASQKKEEGIQEVVRLEHPESLAARQAKVAEAEQRLGRKFAPGRR
jgi:hypothetical protein